MTSATPGSPLADHNTRGQTPWRASWRSGFGMAPHPDDKLLEVTMTKAELLPILEWIKDHYPQMGSVPLQSRTYNA